MSKVISITRTADRKRKPVTQYDQELTACKQMRSGLDSLRRIVKESKKLRIVD